MPDTLSRERIAEIRLDLTEDNLFCGACDNDKIAADLLAHIDALTAAVAAIPWFEPDPDFRIHAMSGEVRKPVTPADHVEAYRAAVLAMLNGEPE